MVYRMSNSGRRILIISPTDSFCGAGQFRHTLALALKQAGYYVALAQPKENTPLQEKESAAGIEHHFFIRDPYTDLDSFFRDRYMAAEELGRTRPNLIVFSSGLSPFCYIPFLEAASFLGVPYIFIEHQVGEYMFRMPEQVRDALSIFYQRAGSDGVITVSDDNLRMLRKCFRLPDDFGRTIILGRSKEFFVPPTQETRSALRKEWNIPEDAFVAITVAKLENVKGHAFLVHAMNRLKHTEAWKKLYFVWAGDGGQRPMLEAAINEIGVADHVRLLGHRWDASKLYDGADVFALTSLSEGLPFTLMEAMAKGLPGLCTDAGGTAEGLGDAGVLLGKPTSAPEVVERLVKAFEVLSTNKEALTVLSLRAKQRAENLFREERMLDEYLTLISKKLQQQ